MRPHGHHDNGHHHLVGASQEDFEGFEEEILDLKFLEVKLAIQP